ncbi:hypothetical protein SAMN05660862_2720 [Sphingobacterium psychroaquaticum]|uniref:Uncharacterized protein n=1 Tax=Sphingobacterium psychroaquaticum TaxID=561061 RepID=A0A1X7KCD9_9SPHI|nr:hypothetical protein SAMN05660862_2720 [Sphingobacterium psychroaquaticum]
MLAFFFHTNRMTDKGLPPFVKNWNQFYILVFAWLVVCILYMYWFTRYFA